MSIQAVLGGWSARLPPASCPSTNGAPHLRRRTRLPDRRWHSRVASETVSQCVANERALAVTPAAISGFFGGRDIGTRASCPRRGLAALVPRVVPFGARASCPRRGLEALVPSVVPLGTRTSCPPRAGSPRSQGCSFGDEGILPSSRAGSPRSQERAGAETGSAGDSDVSLRRCAMLAG